ARRRPDPRPPRLCSARAAEPARAAGRLSRGRSPALPRRLDPADPAGARARARKSSPCGAGSRERRRAMNLLGKLSWSAIPLDQPIPLITSLILVLVIAGVLGLVTWKKWWPYLWREWITSVDYKRIGIMYCVLGVVL